MHVGQGDSTLEGGVRYLNSAFVQTLYPDQVSRLMGQAVPQVNLHTSPICTQPQHHRAVEKIKKDISVMLVINPVFHEKMQTSLL